MSEKSGKKIIGVCSEMLPKRIQKMNDKSKSKVMKSLTVLFALDKMRDNRNGAPRESDTGSSTNSDRQKAGMSVISEEAQLEVSIEHDVDLPHDSASIDSLGVDVHRTMNSINLVDMKAQQDAAEVKRQEKLARNESGYSG